MGKVKSVPVVGEAVTIGEAAVKTVGVAACTIAGKTNSAKKLAKSIGETFEDYTDRNLVSAPLKAIIYENTGQREKLNKLKKRFEDSFGAFSNAPLISEIKEIVENSKFFSIDGSIADRIAEKDINKKARAKLIKEEAARNGEELTLRQSMRRAQNKNAEKQEITSKTRALDEDDYTSSLIGKRTHTGMENAATDTPGIHLPTKRNIPGDLKTAGASVPSLEANDLPEKKRKVS